MRLRPEAPSVLVDDLGLEPGQDPERLRVALEPADVLGPVVEGALAVVAERRVAEVMAEAGGVDDVGRQPQRCREFATDLGHLERVRQAVAGEVGGARGAQHLRLGGEPAQRRGVQHPRAIAGEVVALRAVALGGEARGVRVVVAVGPPGRDPRPPPSAATVVQFRVGEGAGCRFDAEVAGIQPAVRAAPDASACPRGRAGPRRQPRGTARRGRVSRADSSISARLDAVARAARVSPPTGYPLKYQATCLRMSRHPRSSSSKNSTSSSA